jgi:hypothetical protein
MRRSAEGQVAIELDRLLDGHSRTHARIIALRAALRTLPFSQQGLMRNGRYVSSEPWEWTASRTAMLASVMAVRGIDRASLAALGLIDALEVSVPIDQQQIYDLFQMLRSAFTEADEATAILLAKRVIVEAILIGADAAGDLALRPRRDPTDRQFSAVAEALSRPRLTKIVATAQRQLIDEIKWEISTLEHQTDEFVVLTSPLWNHPAPSGGTIFGLISARPLSRFTQASRSGPTGTIDACAGKR